MKMNTAANPQKHPGQRASKTKTMVKVAMLGALAAVLMLFAFPLPFLAPSFYELDFSEVPVLIGSFAMGPLAGAAIELVKILINLLLNGTKTMFVGELANLIVGCAFVIPAGYIYRRNKTRKHAIAGLVIGVVTMTAAAVLMNAYVLLPAYGKAFGMSQDSFIKAGAAIHSSIDSLLDFCLLLVAPFNILKGVFASVITLLLYKRISGLLGR